MSNVIANETNHEVGSIRALRAMNRKAASDVLNRVLRGQHLVDAALDFLYSVPICWKLEATVQHEVDKVSGKSRGMLKLVLEFQMEEPARNNRNGRNGQKSSFTLLLVLGTLKQGVVLTESSLSVSSNCKGKWTITKELDFDWDAAHAAGGEGKGLIILRLLWEEIRGFDSEMTVSL